MSKKQTCDNKHLSLDERKIIQKGIENRCNKVDIARTIGKDPTTVAKEIRKHREFKPRNVRLYPNICIHRKECGTCFKKCELYKEPICKLRDRSPGACNKCPKISNCHLDKYFYYATKSNQEYLDELIDSRTGINLTISEKKQIGQIMAPLLKQGQSVYQVLSSHPEITQCEKTIYNYIEIGVFKDEGIDVFSLKEQVSRKHFKDKYKKRKNIANYDGRKYNDYLKFKESNPNTPTIQMDTVYNNKSGPYIQTFLFEKTMFMFGLIHQEKTSLSMANGLEKIEDNLGHDLYRIHFSLILTDRGVEFEKNELFEFNIKTGEFRTNIFYCDPMQSSQKSKIENNHNYVRDIITNELDISNITQQDLNLIFSHINSTPRESLNGKTPYELQEFLYGKEIIEKLNIKQIKRDEVILKPYLIKHIYK